MKMTDATHQAQAYLDPEPQLARQGERTTTLEAAIDRAKNALLSLQQPQGYWAFELEADCTIPAEYIMMMHYMDEIDHQLQQKIAVYLRARQQRSTGGWPLYHGGDLNLSCSIKAYYALKLAGDHPNSDHMIRAREAILAHGGAARANVFTRIALALFEQIPWRGVPYIPVEIMLFPHWFPFHLNKVSYWSRTVMVPLFILCSLRPKAENPNGVGIRELFTVPPEDEKHYFATRSPLHRVLLVLDALGRTLLEPLTPKWLRKRALKKAEQWITQRLNGTGGLGAIFPAMVNAYETLALLGYPPEHPYRARAKQAIDKLLIEDEKSAYCQPCVSPVWDTALAVLAFQELGGQRVKRAIHSALVWLQQRQLLTHKGDWQTDRPGLDGGGWPFQFRNDHYPDLDDTAAVAWTMVQTNDKWFDKSVKRAADWLVGMQSKNGGFGSFDADNTHYYLNEIPFADHGALLDPPTADVSARCVTLFALLVKDHPEYRAPMKACMAYLRKEQEPEGCWFGRWGTNHIYGTWSVLTAMQQVGISNDDPMIQRAVKWLKSKQRSDGGWGESNHSYADRSLAGEGATSTSFSTAWAMLALMAAGHRDSLEVRRGAEHLMRAQGSDGLWYEPDFSAPGFPRVFYLKYHGYSKYFPLWALARYHKLKF
ncbi:MAG: squalene--hopene cyclase [Gammaproteobacteria bacterium]|nr:squalene--hopene cyclase [Gammaproteobacteria bacterium]